MSAPARCAHRFNWCYSRRQKCKQAARSRAVRAAPAGLCRGDAAVIRDWGMSISRVTAGSGASQVPGTRRSARLQPYVTASRVVCDGSGGGCRLSVCSLHCVGMNCRIQRLKLMCQIICLPVIGYLRIFTGDVWVIYY